MPLLPMAPQLERPAVRPLVAHRLTPPKDPGTGAPFAGTPVETESGLIWTTSERTLMPNGPLALAIPGGQAVWANLTRRWWSFGTKDGAGFLDAATGTIQVYRGFYGGTDDHAIDEHGVPVGTREVEGQTTTFGRPAHGNRLLRLPALYIDSPEWYSSVIAAPKGPTLAGTLTIGSGELPSIRPFRWTSDAAEPRELPVPEGYIQSSINAMNSQGDVAGLIHAVELPDRAVIWPAKGGITFVPIGSRHSDGHILADEDRTRWMAGEPKLLLENGALIGRELAKDVIHGHITTYWDGRRTIWLPDAIEGVRARDFSSLRLTADGRGFLTRIWDGKNWGWYRVSPR